VFFDIGAVVADDAADPAQRKFDADAFRESVGLGIRWNSPMGPIGIAYGFKLDKQDDEDSGNWEFALGAAF
jgi:outer membrane protein insertion porin family